MLKPIFQASCSAGGATCHGDTSDPTIANQMRPYLGPATGTPSAASITSILAALAKPSAEDPSMPLITAGDPTRSYLMYKVNGTQKMLNCTKGDLAAISTSDPCGLYMPFTNPTILSQNIRDTLSAWITEGAPNN